MAEELGKKETTVVTETQTVTTKAARQDGAEAFINDKKGAFPWWIPLLLLLCLVPLIYAFTHRGGTNENAAAPSSRMKPVAVASPPAPTASTPAEPTAPAVASAAPEGTSSTAPSGDAKVFSGKDIATGSTAAASPQGEPLSDVTQFTGAADRNALVGRKVKLTDVKVQRVITDRAFFVGASDAQQMLVLLDKGMDAGTGPQRVNIMPGGTVSLTGVLEKVPNPELAQEQYGLSSANYNDMGKQDVYLHATVAQKKDDPAK